MIGEKVGRYQILGTVGSGSMGTVYRAEDPSDGRIVAVKVISANVLYDLEKRERFLHGLLAVSLIRHPCLNPILEIGDDEDDFFVITPFLTGETLSHMLRSRQVDWSDAIRIALRIGEVISAVHAEGIIFRALKPANIWIGEDLQVHLTDCGIARFTEIERDGQAFELQPKPELADTIIPMGALAYMSPEQVRGEDLDCRSDIFSFGVILYEMLTGRHPFGARNSLSRMSAIVEAQPAPFSARKLNLPAPLEAIIGRTLAKDPQHRYQRMEDLLIDLKRISAADAPPPAGFAPVPSTLPRLRSSARYWIPAALLLLSLAAGSIYLYLAAK